MHLININNQSGHDQVFEVHGWNNNKNLTVKAHGSSVLHAEDKSSGAIIALHDGHEGEQAEITKDGFGGVFNCLCRLISRSVPFLTMTTILRYALGNDFFDLSNIVGAGGNMTVQQVGDNSTRKGDPLFMQHLNEAWHKADAGLKNSLKSCVHLDNAGNVHRIDAIKDHPELEKLVRTFADGKTYIGIGAWGGSPGNANDNAQVSKLLSTYQEYPNTDIPTLELRRPRRQRHPNNLLRRRCHTLPTSPPRPPCRRKIRRPNHRLSPPLRPWHPPLQQIRKSLFLLFLQQLLERQRHRGCKLRPPVPFHHLTSPRQRLRRPSRILQRARTARNLNPGHMGRVPNQRRQRRRRSRRHQSRTRLRWRRHD